MSEQAVDHPAPTRRVAPWLAGGVGLVVVGLLALLLIAGDGGVSETAATPLLDQPAPNVSGTEADGTIFTLSHRKGSWVVLNFFAPDCIPCIDEHPDLVRFVEQQASLGNNGAEFYSIVQSGSRADVEAFFERYGGDWPIVYDDEFEFQTQFGVAQVPETWVVDPNGVVRGRVIGRIASADSLSTELQLLRERFGGLS